MSEKMELSLIDEAARKRFESDWLQGAAKPIEDYLPPVEDSHFLPTLEELVHIELEFAWKRAAAAAGGGTLRPRVEEYVRRFPQLRERDVLRRLAQQEFDVRRRFGDAPDVDEYQRRFGDTLAPDDLLETALRRTGPRVAGSSPAPECIDRYQIQGEHGRGGFGVVWRASDPKLGREVAVKQLNSRMAADEGLRRRFLHEARISARLEHPGVVPVHDIGPIDGEQPYYTMKSVRGQTLADAIEEFHRVKAPHGQRSLEQLRLLNAFLVVAKTMQYAHAQGVIHRDLKPQNILLGDFGETVILDWGLAKVVGADHLADDEPGEGSPWRPEQTRDGSIQGTPAYMPSEQASGRVQEIDQRSDIYALGVILYQLLTGRLPFGGQSFDEIQRQIVSGRAAPPRSVNARVPRALEAICRKAMARDAADRYPTAGELVADLERFLADEPVGAYREPVWASMARWMRKHRAWLAASVGVLAAAMIAVAAIAVLQTVNNHALRIANEKERQAHQRAIDREEEMADLLVDAHRLYDLGRPEEAERALSESVRISTALAEEFPQRERFALLLGKGYSNLGLLHRRMMKLEQAEADYLRSIEVLQELREQAPGNADFASALAASYGNLAALQLHVGDSRMVESPQADPTELAAFLEARRLLEKSIAIREAPPLVASSQPLFQYALSGDYLNLGGVLRRLGRSTAAAGALDKAAGMFEELLAQFPHRVDYVLGSAQVQFNIAQLHYAQQRPDDALDAYTRAGALLGPAVQRAPREQRLIELYGWALSERAELLDELGRHREAAEAFQHAVRYASEAERTRLQSRMMVARVRAGDHAAALEFAQRLAAAGQNDAQAYFQAATFYALAATGVQQDQGLPAAQRRALVEDYAERAMEMLRAAEAGGAFADAERAEELRTSRDFDALRQREDFRDFVERLRNGK